MREEGFSPFVVLDYLEETSAYALLYSMENARNMEPAVLRALNIREDDWSCNQNILIIDRLELLPQLRGKNYGLACMRSAIRHFGVGCSIAAIKPFPLQNEAAFKDRTRPQSPWSAQMQLDQFSASEVRSTAKLRKYYSKLGFKSVKGTSLMVLNLDRPHQGLPTLKEIGLN